MTSVHLSSMNGLLGAVARANSVELASYVLDCRPLIEALEAAARRGATVRVHLESAPMDDARHTLTKRNEKLAARLRAHGIAVELAALPATHLKAAVVDGHAFLDDRNWPGRGPNAMVRDDDPDDVALVRGAVRGHAASNSHLWMRKDAALRAEAQLLRNAKTDHIAVESESFGSGAVSRELQSKAEAGGDVRLLVCDREAHNPREAAVLRRLATAGVHIRVTRCDEKIAVAGGGAWLGSANATAFPPDQIDWGMRTRAPHIVAALRTRFEQNWDAARPLR